jgi:hypothetical protein
MKTLPLIDSGYCGEIATTTLPLINSDWRGQIEKMTPLQKDSCYPWAIWTARLTHWGCAIEIPGMK